MVSYTVKFCNKIIEMPKELKQNGNKNRGVIIRELADSLPKIFDLFLFMPQNPLCVDYEMSQMTLILLGTLSGEWSSIHHLLESDPELETKLI